ncbi:MAG: LPS-assembly protein LptD [Desulfomicrobium escambiense]|nr:LPS-assembly protein LptD [Desulfomicrobium escambiense]
MQRLPQIVFSTMPQPLLDTQLFYQFDSTYDYFWRDQGQRGIVASAFPRLSLPFIHDGWLKFNPEVGLNALSYVSLEDERHYDNSGLFPNIKAELSANFIRIFSFENRLIQKPWHIVEPGILV